MPSRNDSQARSRISWIVRLLGFCVFAAAFFLPAVRAGGSNPEAVEFPGWKCASVALTETVALVGKSGVERPSFEVLLVILSGWINPLVLLVLCFSFWQGLPVVRRVLAVLVLLCMAATWTFFSMQKVTPLIGHYLWIAGALLILLPEALSPGARKAAS
jgi:hypothetical protein